MSMVLIVDDDRSYAGQLARSLERRGYRARVVHDAAAALAAARAEVPDVALLDLRLAEDSGLHLIAPLRALSDDMSIVLLTGYASVATAVDAIKRGADDYLPKPASIEAIVRAIEGEDPATRAATPAQSMLPLRRLEWEHIQQALAASGGNVSAAARMLGMHRRSLQRKLAKRPVAERGRE